MMHKNEKRTVSIRERNGAYTLSYNYYDSNGKRRQKSETCYSHEEAIERKKVLEANSKKCTTAQITFEEVAIRFLQFHAEIRYKPNTYSQTRQLLEHHILPELGQYPLEKITPLDIEQFFANIRNKPRYSHGKRADGSTLSTSTQATIYSIINQIFKRAVAWQYIPTSPVLCGRPRVQNKAPDIMTSSEIQSVLKSMRSEGKDMLELCVHIGYICSARKGELSALTWDNIDFENRTIHFDKQLQRLYKSDIDKTKSQAKPIFVFPSKPSSSTVLAFSSLKTRYSNRVVLVPEQLMNRLVERKKEYDRQREAYMALNLFEDYNLVISHPTGQPIDPCRIGHWFRDFLKLHPDMPMIAFHGIRHSSASYKVKLSNGDYKSVQDQMGHTTSSILMDRYAHFIRQHQVELVNNIEKDFYGYHSLEKNELENLDNALLDDPKFLRLMLQKLLEEHNS